MTKKTTKKPHKKVPKKPRLTKPEKEIQEEVVKYLREKWHHVGWYHPMNNVVAQNKGKKALAFAKMIGEQNKKMGVRKGIPDIVVPVLKKSGANTYGSLYVELKSERGYVRPSQKHMHERLEAHGQKVEVARSLDEFKEIMERYMRLSDPNKVYSI